MGNSASAAGNTSHVQALPTFLGRGRVVVAVGEVRADTPEELHEAGRGGAWDQAVLNTGVGDYI